MTCMWLEVNVRVGEGGREGDGVGGIWDCREGGRESCVEQHHEVLLSVKWWQRKERDAVDRHSKRPIKSHKLSLLLLPPLPLLSSFRSRYLLALP